MNVAAIGEGMLEFSLPRPGLPERGSSVAISYGGDTLNTSIYLSRLGIPCRFVTALGDDRHSDWLISQWRSEGVDTSLIEQVVGRCPGLYMIHTEASGERHFTYWRQEAPVRQMFSDRTATARLFAALSHVDIIYLSAITLSLFGDVGRNHLLDALATFRADGGAIVFDSNYRLRGWAALAEAREWCARLYGITTIALPTHGDEAQLFGDRSPEETAERLLGMGVAEVVVKDGANGALACRGEQREWVAAAAVGKVVDTTAAGDSFNAAYLAARARGESPAAAATAGNALAAQVIQHRGAILPAAALPQGTSEQVKIRDAARGARQRKTRYIR